jgi:cellobiose-specific phosphotransferase system component IIB
MAKLLDLKKAAKEMYEVMILDTPLDENSNSLEAEMYIRKAMVLIEPQDLFSETTQEIIDSLEPYEEVETPKKVPEKKVTPIVEKEIVPEKPKDVEFTTDDLVMEIKNTKKLESLKSLAKKNVLFKSIHKDIAIYQTLSTLQSDMLDILLSGPQKEYVDQDRESTVQKLKTPVIVLPKKKKHSANAQNITILSESSVISGLVVGSVVQFVTAANSKVCPKKELIGTIDTIKLDLNKTTNEVVKIICPEGHFYKYSKSVVLVKSK